MLLNKTFAQDAADAIKDTIGTETGLRLLYRLSTNPNTTISVRACLGRITARLEAIANGEDSPS
jgi:hypothetical protein